MFNLFKKKEEENNISLIAIASLLVHSARIDENYTEKEEKIIREALIEMGADSKNIEIIIKEAEKKRKGLKSNIRFY